MKKLFFIILIFSLLTGCSNNDSNKKEIMKKELTSYMEQNLSSIEYIEKNTITSFNTFTSDESKTAVELIYFLENEIIPQYQVFYDKLININPNNEEILIAHNYYEIAAEYQLDAFNTYLEGLKQFDYEKIKNVNLLINSSKEYLNMHKNELISIAEKYKIEYTITP